MNFSKIDEYKLATEALSGICEHLTRSRRDITVKEFAGQWSGYVAANTRTSQEIYDLQRQVQTVKHLLDEFSEKLNLLAPPIKTGNSANKTSNANSNPAPSPCLDLRLYDKNGDPVLVLDHPVEINYYNGTTATARITILAPLQVKTAWKKDNR